MTSKSPPRSHGLAAGFLQQAKILLLLAVGVSARGYQARPVSSAAIAKWRRRFLEHGLKVLTNRYRGWAPWKLRARARARMLAATRLPPADRTTHWSCLRFATYLGKATVQREGCRAFSTQQTDVISDTSRTIGNEGPAAPGLGMVAK